MKPKLMVMGLLLVVSAVFAYARGYAWHWLACTALGFSWLGDAMLAHFPPIVGKVRDPFLAGMGLFAVSHLVYIFLLEFAMRAMPVLHMPKPGYPLGTSVIFAALPIYWLAAVLFWLLKMLRTDRPKALKIAALAYGLLLATTGAFSLAAAFTGTGFVWILPLGGLLFLVSDAIIALRVFQGAFEKARVYELAVWGTYVPAQLCLLLGISALI